MKKIFVLIASALVISPSFAEEGDKTMTLEEFYSESAGIFAEEAKKARPQDKVQMPQARRKPNTSVKQRVLNRARQPKEFKSAKRAKNRQHNEMLWVFDQYGDSESSEK